MRLDAASFPTGDDAAACAGARLAAPPSTAGSGFARTPWSSCSSRRTGGPHKVLVEMARGEPLVARPVQRLHLFAPIDRNSLARRLADPTIQQAGFAVLLVTAAPATECPLPIPSNSAASSRLNSDASQRPNTSMNFSIRTPCRASVRRILPTSRLGTRYRTVRVLPIPVISSATDSRSPPASPCAKISARIPGSS